MKCSPDPRSTILRLFCGKSNSLTSWKLLCPSFSATKSWVSLPPNASLAVPPSDDSWYTYTQIDVLKLLSYQRWSGKVWNWKKITIFNLVLLNEIFTPSVIILIYKSHRRYMHLKSHIPPVVHFPKISHRGYVVGSSSLFCYLPQPVHPMLWVLSEGVNILFTSDKRLYLLGIHTPSVLKVC